MVLEGNAAGGGQPIPAQRATPLEQGLRGGLAMQVAHQVAFAVVADAIAQDQIMHPAADVDRVDLDIAVMGEGGGEIGRRLVQQQGAPHEATGGGGIDGERGGGHAERRRRRATESTSRAKTKRAAPARRGPRAKDF
ncbi:MAG: hypothetical protein WDM96_07510 [Lacunisphaera sp.]